MSKKVLYFFIGTVVVLTGFTLAVGWGIRRSLGLNQEGLFQLNHCYRDEELGVTVRTTGSAKGKTFATIVASDKYPNEIEFKVGQPKGITSSENPRKLYPLSCPPDL